MYTLRIEECMVYLMGLSKKERVIRGTESLGVHMYTEAEEVMVKLPKRLMVSGYKFF